MWYMHCGGANDSDCPTSMRIVDAWRAGYAGNKVVVTILDDGIETTHPDLRQNYDGNASYDINGMDEDPTPRYDISNENKHGTRCAGVVAAVSGNRICSVGIAYKARIGGIRMLDGEVTDTVEAQSLGFNRQYIDIYSASWGPDDDGNTVEGPGYLAKAAFREGAAIGRGGKGSIFVWASGNGGHNKDSCSCDGYINSIYTIGISSVSQKGKRPWYLESCASTLAATYSSGEINEGKIITTDLRSACTYAHTGTSASAPMGAGVISLMLEANENLTWRDVQHIIVRTSNPRGLQADDWITNGAGYNVSHVFGFGLMDALQLTHVSRNWRTVPEHRRCNNPADRRHRMILAGRSLMLDTDSQGCRGTTDGINFLEHVILRISLSHVYRGSLKIFLTSPAGTVSNILERRPLDRSNSGFDDWDFMTTHHWGENPQGIWRLEIFDQPIRQRYRQASRENRIENKLTSWQLIFFGTESHPQPNFLYNACDAFPQSQCHEECDGCCGATAMECRACLHVSTSMGVCISSCPAGQFPHPTTKICQPCWKTCAECSAAYEWSCTACNIGYSLINGRCVKQCSRGSFLDNVTQRCLSCHQSCRTCSERRDNCTSCKEGFEKLGNSCEASCPPGTYIVSYDSGCTFCHHNCLECNGPLDTQCTQCAHGMVVHRNRCVGQCPAKRYYRDVENNECRPCHKDCKTCEGPYSTDCLSCNSGHDLRDGECRRVCRDEYNGNYSKNPCILVIQLKWCKVPVFHTLCCEMCTQYENGQMFLPPNLSLDNEDLDTPQIEYDYGDDQYSYETEDGYDDAGNHPAVYNGIGDYDEESDSVGADIEFGTGNSESDSHTPILVESGIGKGASREAGDRKTPLARVRSSNQPTNERSSGGDT